MSPALSFADLKQTLGVTDGNLSIHARKLEDAQFIASEKTFQDRRPLTQYTLTAKGRAAFERYQCALPRSAAPRTLSRRTLPRTSE